MAKAKQHGEMKVKCNVCGKEKLVRTADYYRAGGLKGGCCTATKKGKGEDVQVPCTWSTVAVH